MFKKVLALKLAAVAVVALSGCGDKKEIEIVMDAPIDGAPAETITIYRDQYGMPQIFAESNRGVYFGYGHSVATDRLFQMEMLKRTSQGRVAEVLGAAYLDLDIKLRTQYNHPAVRAQVEALTARDRDILEGYAAGFNARIAEIGMHPDFELPKPFIDYGFEPTEWTAEDVASIFVGAIAHRYADFNSERDNLRFLQAMEQKHGKEKAWGLFNAVKWLWDNDSPTTIARSEAVDSGFPARPDYLDALAPTDGVAHIVFDADGKFAGLSSEESLRPVYEAQIAQRGFNTHPEFSPASNYWAMTGFSDAKGALLNGPQFSFSMPSYVYGVGLHGGDFDVVGNTLLALPGLLFAHNNEIAWGSTAGISDQTDEFLLKLNPENPEQYWHNGEWVDFTSWSETIAVKGDAPVTVTARRAAQGMVMDYHPEQGIAWARARAWEGKAVDSLMAWVWIATDKSIEQGVERIGNMVTNINMYLMDKNGRLGYVHSGRYPARTASHDSRLPAVGDGSEDWQGIRPYADNPKTVDPEQGYVMNWNNRPAGNWRSSDLWPYTWARADRSQLLIDDLEAIKGGTVQQMVDINKHSSFADVNRMFLLPYLEQALGDEALPGLLGDARDLLTSWDGLWIADEQGDFSAGATLMEAWVNALQAETFKDDVGDEFWPFFAATNYPTTKQGASIGTSVGVKAIVHQLDAITSGKPSAYDFFNGVPWADVFRNSFETAVASLATQQGSDVSAWRVASAPMEWAPVNFRGVPQASPENKLTFHTYQNRGSENNVFVATGDGIVGRDVVPAGQGGHLKQDGTPAAHYDDQFDLYNRFEYKPLPFTRADVEASAVMEIQLMLDTK